MARHFRRISLLGSLQNAILLLCMHAQNRVHRVHSLHACICICACMHAMLVLALARTTRLRTHPYFSIQYHEGKRATLTFLKKTDRYERFVISWIHAWKHGHNFVKSVSTKRCCSRVLQASDHTPHSSQQLC